MTMSHILMSTCALCHRTPVMLPYADAKFVICPACNAAARAEYARSLAYAETSPASDDDGPAEFDVSGRL